MINIRIFKALNRATAYAGLWQGDKLLAEVFADIDARKLFVSVEASAAGIDWIDFLTAAPRINELLDEGDAEMR